MVNYQKRILLVLFVAVLLTFSRTKLLFAQRGLSGNSGSNAEVVEDQVDDDELEDTGDEMDVETDADIEEDTGDEIFKEESTKEIKDIKKNKKTKKYRKPKEKLTPEQKREKLITRELKRFENANKSILSRERKAKKILKQAEEDRAKELIKHDQRIEEIKNMTFED